MASRLTLQDELETILGSEEVYFQPPESKNYKYDAIVYNRNNVLEKNANNQTYISYDRYEVILIYRDPDSDLPKKLLAAFPYITLTRHFVKDHLYHDVFNLYY